ncbi:MAG TPA: hypothetical protein VGJ57_12200 [Nitrospirales bacterium]
MQIITGFRAKVSFLKTEEGGRKGYVASRIYYPSITFGNKETGSQFEIENLERVLPGEQCVAKVILVSPEFVYSELKVNAPFEVREGSKIVGRGIILEVF